PIHQPGRLGIFHSSLHQHDAVVESPNRQVGDLSLQPTVNRTGMLGVFHSRPRNAFTCAVVTLPQVPPYADGCHTCSIPSRTSASGWCLLIQYWPLFISANTHCSMLIVGTSLISICR